MSRIQYILFLYKKLKENHKRKVIQVLCVCPFELLAQENLEVLLVLLYPPLFDIDITLSSGTYL